MLLRTKRHLAELSTRPHLPKLLVLGDHDQFSSLASLQKVFKPKKQNSGQQDSTADSSLSKVAVDTMTDCDHFYLRQRAELAKKVLYFCENVVQEERSNSHLTAHKT